MSKFLYLFYPRWSKQSDPPPSLPLSCSVLDSCLTVYTRLWDVEKGDATSMACTGRYKHSMVKWRNQFVVFGGESYNPYMYYNTLSTLHTDTP